MKAATLTFALPPVPATHPAILAPLARGCAHLVIAIAGTVLVGWVLGAPGIIRLGLASGAMAPNTAVGFFAAGLGLLLALRSGFTSRAPSVLATIPLIAGGLTALEYLADLDLGIDQIVLADPLGLVQTGHPGRMAMLTSVVMTLSGSALLMVSSGAGLLQRLGAWLCLPQFVLAVFALFGIGFFAPLLQQSSGTAGIALSTVLVMLAQSVGLLCARPYGPVAIFTADGEGGNLARRIIPAVVLLPPALGWVLLQGFEAGHYGPQGFAVLTAVLTLLILGAGAWLLAVVLERRDAERRAALEALGHSRQMLDRAQEVSHVGGWEIDVPSGRIAWTREVYRIHEVGPDHDPNDLQRNLGFYAPADRERLGAAIAAACSDGTPWEFESEFVTARGRRRWVQTAARAERREGRTVRVYGHIVDITERREAQLALREANAALEQRVKERTASLEAANKDLEGFSYSVSHDLRAPLRAIDSYSNILLEEYQAQLGDEGQRLLQSVRRNAQRMARLIDDMLVFSRLGRSAPSRSDVNMDALCNDALAEVAPPGTAPTPAISVTSLPPAHGDAAMLRQVLVNLLSNAVKFSGGRADPRIQIAGSSAADEVTYTVSDNGVGFDPAYAHKLFGVFQRLHSPEEFPGTGIGLAIVKRIVEKHGGRVGAEGRLGAGATFHFSLPLNARTTETPTP